jgi:hypothetical protein
MPKFYDPTRPLIYCSPDDNGGGAASGIDDDKLNKVVADHVGRAAKKIQAAHAAEFAELKKLLGGDGLKAAVEQALVGMVGEDTPAAPAAGAKPGEAAVQSPEIEALKAQIARLEKQHTTLSQSAKEERKAKEAAEARSKTTRVNAALRTGLGTKLGADSKFIPDLLKSLGDRVDEDEREQARMRFQRTAEDGTAEDEWLPIDKGIEKWAKEEGAHYVPSRGVRLPVAGMGWPPQFQQQHDERQGAGAVSMPWLAEVGDAVAKRNPVAAAQLAAAAQAPIPKPPK